MYLPGRPGDVGPHCRNLLGLSSTTWTPHDFRLACVINGWTLKHFPPSPAFHVGLDDQMVLTVDFDKLQTFYDCDGSEKWPQGMTWQQAVVRIYCHHEGNYRRDEEFYEFGQADFDRAFEVARDTMVGRLGPPEVEGAHAIGWLSDCHYRFCTWRGERGLLVLQQGELDLHCGGVDISVCLHPWEEDSPTPQMPLLVDGPI